MFNGGVAGAGATTTFGNGGGLPVSTYLVTLADPSTAPTEVSKTSQNTEVAAISNFGYAPSNGVNGATSTTNSNVGVVESISDFANAWSNNSPGSQAFGGSLIIESPSNVIPTSATLDLYELIPTGDAGNTGHGKLLGDFTLSSDGTLDFTSSAAAVPEPSTYALLFGGLGALFWFRRLRRNSFGA